MKLKKDSRFTVTSEFTGDPTAQYVVRFCTRWVKSYPTKTEAVAFAESLKLELNRSLESSGLYPDAIRSAMQKPYWH